MLGLIYKDLLVSRKYFKSVFLLVAFYFIFGIITNNIMFAAYMIIILSTMIIFSTFSFDEVAKWDSFALSLPVKRSKIVLSKYVIAYTWSALGAIFSIATYCIYNTVNKVAIESESFISAGVALELSILVVSVTTPVIYKYGIEKGRLALFVILGVPAILTLYIASKINVTMPSESTIKLLVLISPIVTILIALISIYLSITIYNKKEV
jgi:hypothetical protein